MSACLSLLTTPGYQSPPNLEIFQPTGTLLFSLIEWVRSCLVRSAMQWDSFSLFCTGTCCIWAACALYCLVRWNKTPAWTNNICKHQANLQSLLLFIHQSSTLIHLGNIKTLTTSNHCQLRLVECWWFEMKVPRRLPAINYDFQLINF